MLALALATVLTAAGFFASRVLEKRTYALHYPDEIRLYADEYGLNRYLVAAVIHCESGNRPAVRSPKGAVGLMQIMPATGAWIAEKLELKGFHEDMLLDPAVNIRFGCWYLSYLNVRYDDEKKVLAAYNAGPGNVEKWLGDAKYSEEGQLVSIPFPETSNYVERVKRAGQKYEELYERELKK